MFEVKTIESYQAADGQIFSTYEEAEAHNAKIAAQSMENEVTFFDEEGKVIPLEKAINNYDNVFFFVVHSADGARWMINYLHNHYYDELGEIKQEVYYRYDSEEEDWFSSEEELDRLSLKWNGLVKFTA